MALDIYTLLFIAAFALVIFGILSQATDSSGKKVGFEAFRLIALAILPFVAFVISIAIPYIILNALGIAEPLYIGIFVFIAVLLVPAYAGECIERFRRGKIPNDSSEKIKDKSKCES